MVSNLTNEILTKKGIKNESIFRYFNFFHIIHLYQYAIQKLRQVTEKPPKTPL